MSWFISGNWVQSIVFQKVEAELQLFFSSHSLFLSPLLVHSFTLFVRSGNKGHEGAALIPLFNQMTQLLLYYVCAWPCSPTMMAQLIAFCIVVVKQKTLHILNLELWSFLLDSLFFIFKAGDLEIPCV